MGGGFYGHGDPPGRYITIDRWENKEHWRLFLNGCEVAYRALDTQLEGLTSTERPLFEGNS